MRDGKKRSPGREWAASIAAAVRDSRSIIILGVGNQLRGDDAAGMLVLGALEVPPLPASSGRRCLLVRGGDVPESTTGTIRSFRPDLVILIDATRAGRRKGAIFRVDPRDLTVEEMSTHRIPLSLLVRYLEDDIGARTLFLGIEPAETGPGAPVSRAVLRSAGILAREIRKAIAAPAGVVKSSSA